MRRCRKHYWLRRRADFSAGIDISPGAVNIFLPPMDIEICMDCKKVRRVSEIQNNEI